MFQVSLFTVAFGSKLRTPGAVPITFTRANSGMTGTSPGLVWKDPALISHFHIYPSPFNRKIHKEQKVEYILHEPCDVEILVVSVIGTHVWSINFSAGEPGGMEGRNSVILYGRNGRGRKVESGAYTLRINVANARRSQTLKRKIGIVSGKKR